MSTIVLLWLLPVLLAVALLLIATLKPRFLTPRVCAEAATGLLVASFPFAVAGPFTPATKIGVAVLQLWLILIALRLLFGRLDAAFLRPSTRINSLAAGSLCVGIAGLWWLGTVFPGLLGGYNWRIEALICVVLAAYLMFAAQLLWAARHYKLHVDDPHRSLKELPTVSVCIPARNETHALEDCLLSVLASSYPKLEVLVLDDCSQDKTSQVIRSFAHDGVRFVRGEAPADGWLGRNQALETLAAQATGDYILFMDVDTRLNIPTIAQLIDYILDNKMEMLAVLPQNRLGLQPGALLGALRPFWQMVLPLTKRRVPVSSQAWMIRADTLRHLGGFASVAHKIVPEGSFARRLQTTNQYRFIAGHTALGITTAKRWPSELESAIRILYPTYKRQPMFALATMCATMCGFVLPFILFAYLLLLHQWDNLLLLDAVTCSVAYAVAAAVFVRIRPRSWLAATLLLPIVGAQEVCLIATSMLQYEFGEVNWKGRNVCYPVISSAQNQQPAPAPPAGR